MKAAPQTTVRGARQSPTPHSSLHQHQPFCRRQPAPGISASPGSSAAHKHVFAVSLFKVFMSLGALHHSIGRKGNSEHINNLLFLNKKQNSIFSSPLFYTSYLTNLNLRVLQTEYTLFFQCLPHHLYISPMFYQKG